MNYRNPVYTATGDIDCEIEHPTLGWIPFTASPNDSESSGVALFNQIELDGGIASYVPDLPKLKLNARWVVDAAAERARLRYITAGSGQAMAYQEKGDEAADYIAASYPAATGSPPVYVGYPFITAEVNATGKTSTQAADDIIAQRSAWVAVGAQIEEARLGGKKAVDDATDVAGVEAARDAAITSLDAI